MNTTHFYITNKETRIPAVIWGEQSSKLLIEVHGNLSNKEDTVISMMAERALQKGYQALSFDLPMHGERANEAYACNPWNCVSDLTAVFEFYNVPMKSDTKLNNEMTPDKIKEESKERCQKWRREHSTQNTRQKS